MPADTAKIQAAKLTALISLLIGAGFLLKAWQEWKFATAVNGDPQLSPSPVKGQLVGLGSASVQTKSGVKIRKFKSASIDQMLGEIKRLVNKGSEDVTVRDAASSVLAVKTEDGRWAVPPKDRTAEAKALFLAITNPRSPYAIRYTQDHAKHDQYNSAKRTLKLKVGDCDDGVVLLGAMLMSVGHRPELVTMQAKGAQDWSHILLRVPTGSGTDEMGGGVSDSYGGAFSANHDGYLYLDPTMADKGYPAGWSPPGLREALVTGRASGMIVKARIDRT